MKTIDKLGSCEWQPGEIVVRSGIYSNMPLDRYHRGDVCNGPSISSSGLRRIYNATPAHYWCESPLNPKRIVAKEKITPRHFVIGRAAHHLFFGEAAFNRLFIAAPPRVPDHTGQLKDFSLRLKYAKEWVLARQRQGLEALFPDEIESIEGMARALEQYWLCERGAFKGYIERSAFFKHKEAAVWVKVRPDVIPTDSGDVVDLKTCESALDRDVDRAINQHGYRQQFALMRWVFRNLALPWSSGTLIFVEKSPPYAFNAVAIDEGDLDIAEREMMHALETFARCLKSGKWPGPGGEGHIRTFRMSDRDRELAEQRIAAENAASDRRAA